LSDFEGWIAINQAVHEFRRILTSRGAVIAADDPPRHENPDLKNASSEVLSWLRSGRLTARFKVEGRNEGDVPCRYWRRQLARQTLITGTVPFSQQMGIAGTVMVPVETMAALVQDYLRLFDSTLAAGRLVPALDEGRAAPPLAYFRDLRVPDDPKDPEAQKVRKARERELSEYQDRVARGETEVLDEPRSLLSEALERGSRTNTAAPGIEAAESTGSPKAEHRAAYVRRVAEFDKDHPGRIPPVQITKSGLEGDREWAIREGISRDEITKFRREILKTKLGRPPLG
jgi:hypothetical protein